MFVIVFSSLPIYLQLTEIGKLVKACFEKDWQTQRRAEQVLVYVSECHSKGNIVLFLLFKTLPVDFKNTFKEIGLFVLLCGNVESGNTHCSFWVFLVFFVFLNDKE